MSGPLSPGVAQTWAQAGLLYDVDDAGVAWLRLNRPERRNAMDLPLRRALLDAIHEATEDKAVKAGVITGNGSAFSAGADLRQADPMELPSERRRSGSAARDDGLLYGWYRLLEALWRSETPFIAAVNGPAIGGGCQLALACDLVYASEEATFWEVFARIGLPLEGGAAWLLTRSLSLARAKEMALLAEPLTAQKAETWGLVNQCLPAAELESTVRTVAHRLATLGPPGTGPSAADGRDVSARLGHIKGQLNAAWEQTMWQTFREEVGLFSVPPGESDRG
jgi:2-(1,2-epoxy-1,2-dihydrophenyl)acetyl-CoA isomerase